MTLWQTASPAVQREDADHLRQRRRLILQGLRSGSKLVENAGATMGEEVASVKRVTDIVAEISAASTEQSTGIEEVNRAIVLMDESTQQNAALVEQAAAAARAMQDQAAQLAQIVGIFKLH